jgi:hypothetical protein
MLGFHRPSLPDPGLTGHQDRVTSATGDLPRSQPDLVEFGGATNQAVLRVGTDIPRHREPPRTACR